MFWADGSGVQNTVEVADDALPFGRKQIASCPTCDFHEPIVQTCGEFQFSIWENKRCLLPKGHPTPHNFLPHDCADCGRRHGVCKNCGTTHGDSHERSCKWARV